MLIFVLVIIFDIKDIRIIDNALRRQLFQPVNVVSCILGTFRSNLIAIQNAKALEHQGCRLRFTTSKIIKCLPYIFCHVFPSYLCFHHRTIRIFAAEIFIQTQGSRQINGVLKVHIPVIASTEYFDHLPLLPLILDIKAGVLIFTQILNQLFADHRRFAQIGILIFAFTDLCLCIGSREEAQNLLELRSGFEEEINFILQIFYSNAAAAVWRHNMDIEIPFRLRSATLSWQAEKQIAFTENVMAIPVQIALINLKSRNILLCVPIKAAVNQLIEIAIQFAVCHDGSLLFNLLIIVNDLIHINVILVIGIVVDNKLTGYRGHDILQRSLNQSQQEICILLRHRQEQAKIILQVLCRQSEMHIQAIRSQTMNTQCIDNFNCQRLVCCLRECTVNNILQLSTGSNNTVDGHVTLKQSVGFDCRPIIIKRDDARLILWHIAVKNIANCHRDVFQDMPILNQVNLIEHINIGRMNWEQIYKLVHP